MTPERPVPPPDRSIDVALAEFVALRAELLGHSTSQTTVLGLGLTAIGVLFGLGVDSAARSGLLIFVPVLCAVLVLVYTGLAYRIVVTGNYIRVVLWPYLEQRLPTSRLPSWERGLAALEARWPHRMLAQVVELSLVILLVVIGSVAIRMATGAPEGVRLGVAILLSLAAAVGVALGWRRALDAGTFEPGER